MMIDRKALMTAAWINTRNDAAAHWVYDWAPGPSYGARRETTAAERRAVFAAHLSAAWARAKRNAELAAQAEAALAGLSADALRAEVEALENTDRLGWQGIRRLSDLRRALAKVAAREAREAEAAALTAEIPAEVIEARRALIRAARGRFVGVTFTKKDGTERTMIVQPAALARHVKGEAAEPSARKAAETRAARHPHLLPVWSVADAAVRSVNLAAVSRIATGGTVHTFTAGH